MKYFRHKLGVYVSGNGCDFGSRGVLGMGMIPIPSIDTVDTCELGVSIDTGTKYRMFRYCARAVYVQRACAKTCLVKSQMFVKCVNAVLYY